MHCTAFPYLDMLIAYQAVFKQCLNNQLNFCGRPLKVCIAFYMKYISYNKHTTILIALIIRASMSMNNTTLLLGSNSTTRTLMFGEILQWLSRLSGRGGNPHQQRDTVLL